MGSIIQSTGISTDPSLRSSIAHAALAGKLCIERACIEAGDIGLIMNVGIYRDRNMVEPSMAAMIQKELGINPDYVKFPIRKSAFSFDLMNGGIGALYAMQIADSFLQSGAAQHVLIVASESHPSNKEVADFPYANIGSAILMSPGDDPARGFQSFKFSSSPELNAGTTGSFKPMECGAHGQEIIDVQVSATYAFQALAHGITTGCDFINTNKITRENTTLICSQINAKFGTGLASGLDIPAKSLVNLYQQYGDTFTSSFGLGFHKLTAEQSLVKGQQILFMGTTSGLTSGCAFYIV